MSSSQDNRMRGIVAIRDGKLARPTTCEACGAGPEPLVVKPGRRIYRSWSTARADLRRSLREAA